jgi:PAS domain-containing protein
MASDTQNKTPWFKNTAFYLILSIVANTTWVADYFDIVKFKKEISQSEKTELLTEIKEDRDYYKDLFRNCNDNIRKVEREVSQLKVNMLLLQTTGDHFPFPMWTKDVRSVMIDMNDEYERVFLKPFGITKEQYINKKDDDIWPEEVAEKFRQNDLQALKQRRPYITVEMIPNAAGVMEPWNVIKFRLEIGGEPIGIRGFAFPK